ncbi:ABC transporter ATP-binding protein [Myceligenerans pegani]|uniref:ABC transporter ATP-binding protein n=1 Tax=Myceligenerans pegani TaxID=2776917 RepID=A0ABR9N0Q9_9MICO|nr:ABC transporter ATP-binding protein [Myceligenerans sp. TRM 65318]MBE1876744.1 ABC transporter ATP-binding protein [Myceligenerans sp. TRM 65318]MBE3019015.1 ABC transporter ATP-binding protein [Myceligenerans sp. TRM 65318]
MNRDPVLSVSGLSVTYDVDPPVEAVRDVSLTVGQGEVLGLAGESGCGKSTLAYAVQRLLRPPAEITGGQVVLHAVDGAAGGDVDLTTLSPAEMDRLRWDQVAMVFQGAMNSLNPVLTIGAQLADVFTRHRPAMGRAERTATCGALLEMVGVGADRLRSYPHELSGGMRQRVMIAMALALRPRLLIMDEPTTALDVLVQREILQEISRLREELGFSVVFITHDLPLLLEISDRIAVMRAGRVVEVGTASEIYHAARHEYTKRLLGSFPSLTGDRGDFVRKGAAV